MRKDQVVRIMGDQNDKLTNKLQQEMEKYNRTAEEVLLADPFLAGQIHNMNVLSLRLLPLIISE